MLNKKHFLYFFKCFILVKYYINYFISLEKKKLTFFCIFSSKVQVISFHDNHNAQDLFHIKSPLGSLVIYKQFFLLKINFNLRNFCNRKITMNDFCYYVLVDVWQNPTIISILVKPEKTVVEIYI